MIGSLKKFWRQRSCCSNGNGVSSGLPILVALVAFASGCKKKAPPPPPPPPPPAPAPAPPPPAAPDIASFSAEPSSIERGQSSTLSWTVTNANQITIDNGVGTVQATGSRSVYPNDTTTYKLTASGPGGTLSKTATVTSQHRLPPAATTRPRHRLTTASTPVAGCVLRLRQERHPRRCPRRADQGRRCCLRPSCRNSRSAASAGRALRRARLGRIQSRLGRPPRHRRQRLPGATRCSRRQV